MSVSKRRPPIAVVGLGYVGLPLAIEFGKIQPTIGYDIDIKRVSELREACDANRESSPAEIRAARHLSFTSDEAELGRSDFIIVTVPTPVTDDKRPDLSFVEAASRTVGRNLRKGAIVVFEPTVYPGVTEEICVPILEAESGLKYMKDFKVGYSPERINPGDKNHTVVNIVKVVSGCDKASLETIARTYAKVVKAGVYKAASIKTAEAAKVIENTQRDLNIALMNELALIFHRMGIDTRSVIEAAGTKWNFLKFYPGLVGGHCIGVDPYYLTHKAQELDYHPHVILSGRTINDDMGRYVARQTMDQLKAAGRTAKHPKVLVLGITFKENVSDIRNSRVIDLVRMLQESGAQTLVCDPHADPEAVKEEYGIELCAYDGTARLDAIVVAVAHEEFKRALTPASLKRHLAGGRGRGVVVDVKGLLDPERVRKQGLVYWRL